MSHEIVLVGPMDYFFNPAAEAAREKGLTVVRYRMPADFLAAEAPLSRAAVLYAVGFCPVTREHMAAAPNLRAVISPWTGTEGFDERAATELGIVVGNGAIAENAESMAEATVLMLLSCLYDVNATQQRFRDNIWAQAQLTARMLKGKTVGILGYGGIARGIVQHLAGWGVRFLATTRHPPDDAPTSVQFAPLERMLEGSDIVCVLAPLTDETRGLLGAERLAMMKRGSILVCTSRGGIIDEAALVDLVNAGHFAAVGLDVFSVEPLPMESPIRRLPKAFLTPHGIGHTQEARRILIDTGVANVMRVLEGSEPLYIRNPDVLERWRAKWGGSASA